MKNFFIKALTIFGLATTSLLVVGGIGDKTYNISETNYTANWQMVKQNSDTLDISYGINTDIQLQQFENILLKFVFTNYTPRVDDGMFGIAVYDELNQEIEFINISWGELEINVFNDTTTTYIYLYTTDYYNFYEIYVTTLDWEIVISNVYRFDTYVWVG